MPKEIVMTVGKNGIVIEANGFSGKACEKALEVFKKNIGAYSEIEEKPELYDQEQQEEQCLYQ